MFQLTQQEWELLKSQFVISSWGGTRYLPYAFTEQGLAMLSGILNSEVAVNVNVPIMRAFVEIRRYVESSKNESKKISELSERMKSLEGVLYELSEDNQKKFDDIYLALSQLAQKQKSGNKHRRAIGYNQEREV